MPTRVYRWVIGWQPDIVKTVRTLKSLNSKMTNLESTVDTVSGVAAFNTTVWLIVTVFIRSKLSGKRECNGHLLHPGVECSCMRTWTPR